MKNILAIAFSLFSISVGAAPQNGEWVNSLVAIRQAREFASLQKADDLLKVFPLSPKEQSVIENEIKAGTLKNFIAPKVSMPEKTLVRLKFEGSLIELDYKELNLDRVYLNGKPIQLDTKKSFYNYRGEVDAVLAPSGKTAWLLSLFIPLLHAAPDGSGKAVSSAVAAALANLRHAAGLQLPLGDSVEAALIYAYQLDAHRAQFDAFTGQKTSIPRFTTLTFACDGTKLTEVRSSVLTVGREQRTAAQKKNDVSLVAKKDGGYVFTDFLCGVGQVREDGLITSFARKDNFPEGACLDQGRNLFESGPFYKFPAVAKACCEQENCYANVSRELENLQNRVSKGEQMTKPKPPGQR